MDFKLYIMRKMMLFFVLFSLVNCSKKSPAHVDVGIVIYSNGFESAISKLYSRGDNDEVAVKFSSRKLLFEEGGHRIEILWRESLGEISDNYHFDLVVDGVKSSKLLTYKGQEIIILKKPFRIVLRNVLEREE